jgi:hypothetical protein
VDPSTTSSVKLGEKTWINSALPLAATFRHGVCCSETAEVSVEAGCVRNNGRPIVRHGCWVARIAGVAGAPKHLTVEEPQVAQAPVLLVGRWRAGGGEAWLQRAWLQRELSGDGWGVIASQRAPLLPPAAGARLNIATVHACRSSRPRRQTQHTPRATLVHSHGAIRRPATPCPIRWSLADSSASRYRLTVFSTRLRTATRPLARECDSAKPLAMM